ncbi:hypothetical protein SAMN05216456_1915 [Devosia crocina]|uniref:Uncharacterized protein n=1 Tax=Devosia crocina TaxID=429728 RepID=A0A1I7NEU4_9HYPH|nr:hypothetical protein [Devosia crocina]SFV33192.1 hypothetical protein SAMN05216456_1915 [Devosia crocina]
MKFDVLRQHYGDKQYWPGDVRDASEADVKHLLESGVLKRQKAEPKTQNKVEPPIETKRMTKKAD